MVDPRIGVPYGEGLNGNRGPYDDEHQRWERQYPTSASEGHNGMCKLTRVLYAGVFAHILPSCRCSCGRKICFIERASHIIYQIRVRSTRGEVWGLQKNRRQNWQAQGSPRAWKVTTQKETADYISAT